MGGGGGGSSKVKSDINVTPLVDVVLVLLIIFLVTMPILMKDITIDIPRKSDQDVPADMMPDQVTIELKGDGRLLMSGQEINRTELAEKLRDRLDRMREKIVFVDFDDSVRYGDAVAIMDVCKGAGASKVGLKMRDENAGQQGQPGAPSPTTP
jgi:biopolymer transport protein ExbD